MSKSLDEILTALGDDAVVVKEAIEVERQRGIEESRKKGADVKKWMTATNQLRDLLREKGIDPDNDISDQLDSKLSVGKQVQSESEKQLRLLEKQVKTLTEQMAEKEKIANEKTQKLQRAKLQTLLGKGLGERVYASDQVIRNLILEGSVRLQGDDETAVWMDGENEIDLEKGIQNFLKANPSIVKNLQNPGSGSSKTETGTTTQKTMTRQSFDSLSPTEKMDFSKSGGKLTE